jgi:predicted alpha/beta hydrolase
MQLVPLTAPDGATSSARYFDASGKAVAAVVVLPAMGVNARSYDAFAAALAERGVAVLVAEHRAGETSSVRPRRGVDFGYAELLSEWPALFAALRERTPHVPISLLGHSMGGQLAVAALNRWHTPGARLVLVASGTVHHRAWKGVEAFAVLSGTWLAARLATTLGYFPGHRLGFGGKQGRGLITDWARASRTGVFRATDGSLEVGLEHAQPRVLAVHVTGDTYAPREATTHLLAKLPGARVHWTELPPPPTPHRLNPHFRWLRAPMPFAERVAQFLAEP